MMKAGDIYVQKRRALMPGMQGQNSDADTRGHDAHQLNAVLSEMQAGNAGEREKTEYGDN